MRNEEGKDIWAERKREEEKERKRTKGKGRREAYIIKVYLSFISTAQDRHYRRIFRSNNKIKIRTSIKFKKKLKREKKERKE